MHRRALMALWGLVLFCRSFAAIADTAALVLQPLDGAERRVGAAEWAALPHVRLEAKDHGGKDTVFEGVSLRDVLDLAGAPAGKALRGRNLAQYVLVEAADGYRVVYTLAEMDPDFQAGVILIADRRDGQPLDATDGPLRIIVPADKHQARWVRQLVRISVRQAAE